MPRAKSRNSDKNLFIYQPEGFDPAQYTGTIANHPDAARWLLNCIYFRRVTRNYAPDAFVNLHSESLASVMGDVNLVKPVREAMRVAGLIECDDLWWRQRDGMPGKSLGYRIGPALQGKRWHRWWPTGARSIKRIKAVIEEARQPTGLTLPVHHHLADWLTLIQVSPDAAEVATTIEDKDRRSLAINQLAEIERGGWSPSVCRYGRFHSPFTSLVREARGCLSVDGSPLIELDLKNSQPYFLALMLAEITMSGFNVSDLSSHWSNCLLYDHDLIMKVLECNQATEAEREREGGEHHKSLVLYPNQPQTETSREAEREGEGGQHHKSLVLYPNNTPSDLSEFIEDTVRGRLYERLMTETETETGKRPSDLPSRSSMVRGT
jgi:hypothetical protein